MDIKIECDGKAVHIIVPDDLSLDRKKTAFDSARDALLRDEIEAQLRARITDAGFDYDEIVAQNRAAGR